MALDIFVVETSEAMRAPIARAIEETCPVVTVRLGRETAKVSPVEANTCNNASGEVSFLQEPGLAEDIGVLVGPNTGRQHREGNGKWCGA